MSDENDNDQLEPGASEGASDDGTGDQDATPGDDVPGVSDDETGADDAHEENAQTLEADAVDPFDAKYGHLEGDQLETARKVHEAQVAQQEEADALAERGYTGD